jgi:hypothetical protein
MWSPAPSADGMGSMITSTAERVTLGVAEFTYPNGLVRIVLAYTGDPGWAIAHPYGGPQMAYCSPIWGTPDGLLTLRRMGVPHMAYRQERNEKDAPTKSAILSQIRTYATHLRHTATWHPSHYIVRHPTLYREMSG